VTNEERLVSVKAIIAALDASILKLAGKTNQSVSFGDQTYSLADIGKLDALRDKYRNEERSLESRLAGGTKRRTIKIGFPSC
jgi:benzoyl-CoA reductase/2-hydroxyglutaryl-CoA dehydratase subunit BcrC/BadD/HgdB